MKIQGHWWTKPYQDQLEGLENFLSELNAALKEQGDTICRPALPTGEAEDPMEMDYGKEFVRIGPAKDPKLAKTRPFQLCRPCPCGTCRAGTPQGFVGYVTGGTSQSYVTVRIEHEDVYHALRSLFWAHGLKADV